MVENSLPDAKSCSKCSDKSATASCIMTRAHRTIPKRHVLVPHLRRRKRWLERRSNCDRVTETQLPPPPRPTTLVANWNTAITTTNMERLYSSTYTQITLFWTDVIMVSNIPFATGGRGSGINLLSDKGPCCEQLSVPNTFLKVCKGPV